MKTCLMTRRHSLIKQRKNSNRSDCCLTIGRGKSIVKKTSLPRVLLHGQSDPDGEAEARLAAQMIHKTVNEVITNHNQTLVNTVINIMKTILFGALVDQIGSAYFSGFNPSAVGSNVTSSSQ